MGYLPITLATICLVMEKKKEMQTNKAIVYARPLS